MPGFRAHGPVCHKWRTCLIRSGLFGAIKKIVSILGGKEAPLLPQITNRGGSTSLCSTDGTWYLPLNMPGQGTSVETALGCQQRCRSTAGSEYFNSFLNGSCRITTGSGGTQGGGKDPTTKSGSKNCGDPPATYHEKSGRMANTRLPAKPGNLPLAL